MDNDNVYPTSSRFYKPKTPEDQKKAEQKEQIDTLAQVPVLEKVLAHWDDRIAATDSVKQAFVLADKYQIPKEIALIVMDIVRQQVEAERSYVAACVKKLR